MNFSHASLKIWRLAIFPWSHCDQRPSLRMWQASGLPTPPANPWQGLLPLPHSHSNSQALHWYKQTRKKNSSSCVGKKNISNLQAVAAKLCFSENSRKLIHQYLALTTESMECPTKCLFFLLFATKPADCHYCLSFRDRQTLSLFFSSKPRGKGIGQLPHWAALLVQWVFTRMNKDHKS